MVDLIKLKKKEVWCSSPYAGAFLGLLSDARDLYELSFIVNFESFAMLWPAWRELRCGAGPGPPQVQADGLLTVQGQPCDEGIQELQADVGAQPNPQGAKPYTCTMCERASNVGSMWSHQKQHSMRKLQVQWVWQGIFWHLGPRHPQKDAHRGTTYVKC